MHEPTLFDLAYILAGVLAGWLGEFTRQQRKRRK